MFLLIGGEGEETPGWLRAGALSDYAQQFNGRQSSVESLYSPGVEGWGS